MKLSLKQNGLTLVEVLATIVILSITVVLVTSILFNGLNLSNKVESKAQLQQEANYIITSLKEQHLKGEKYEIKLNEHGKILITNIATNTTTIIGNEKFTYEVSEIINSCQNADIDCIETIDTATVTNKFIIEPLTENFHARIKLISNNNNDLTYEITTILSRM